MTERGYVILLLLYCSVLVQECCCSQELVIDTNEQTLESAHQCQTRSRPNNPGKAGEAFRFHLSGSTKRRIKLGTTPTSGESPLLCLRAFGQASILLSKSIGSGYQFMTRYVIVRGTKCSAVFFSGETNSRSEKTRNKLRLHNKQENYNFSTS